jgi:hypothetical protein
MPRDMPRGMLCRTVIAISVNPEVPKKSDRPHTAASTLAVRMILAGIGDN